MTWFRVDDGWHDHPKVVGLSMAARGLWTTAGTWCARHGTDGRVPKSMLRVWRATRRQATELVDAGLWHDARDAWTFHEWSAHQPLRSEVEARREAERQRKREYRAKRNRAVVDDVPPGHAEDVPGDSASRGRSPDPTRPVPARPVHVDHAARDRRARGVPPPEPPPDVEPTALTRDPAAELRRAVAERYADAHLELTGAVWPAERFRAERAELAELIEREAESRRCEPVELLTAVLRHFVADAWVRKTLPSMRYLVGNLHKHLPTRAETRRRTLRDERNELLECIRLDYQSTPAQVRGFEVQLKRLEANVLARADAGDTDPDIIALADELRGRAAS